MKLGSGLTGVVVAALLLLAPARAFAEDASAVRVEATGPSRVTVGDMVEISVTVTSGSGSPVAGAYVVATAEGSFAGVSGRYELAAAYTSDDGAATLRWVQKSNDLTGLQVEYIGGTDRVTVPLDVAVSPGGQVYQPEIGIHIPWLTGAWLVGLVGLVWAMIAYAVSRVFLISREASSVSRVVRLVPVLLTGLVALGGIGLVAVLTRNPESHWNLRSPEGYARTPIADVNSPVGYAGPGNKLTQVEADGLTLYVNAECMGCHGVAGRGGTVGGSIVGDLDEGLDAFIRTVRRGPKGMPEYLPEVLGDDKIAAIYQYLVEANRSGS